jgi:5'(3')-deoxyribonucleotidase
MKIYNKKDTRRIGFDIDNVLADFVGRYCDLFNLDLPLEWDFDSKFPARMAAICEIRQFWINLKVKEDPKDFKFKPVCYITDRVIPIAWTKEWLKKNGFPNAPIYTAKHGKSKSDIAVEKKLDVFVDDNYEHFTKINKAGIKCYLYDCTHNRQHNVGNKRIFKLSDIL